MLAHDRAPGTGVVQAVLDAASGSACEGEMRQEHRLLCFTDELRERRPFFFLYRHRRRPVRLLVRVFYTLGAADVDQVHA